MHFLLFLRSGNSSYQEELFLKDHFIGAYTLNKETSMLSSQWKDNKVHKVKSISLYTGISVFISQRNFNSLKKKRVTKVSYQLQDNFLAHRNHHRSKINRIFVSGGSYVGIKFQSVLQWRRKVQQEKTIFDTFWNSIHSHKDLLRTPHYFCSHSLEVSLWMIKVWPLFHLDLSNNLTLPLPFATTKQLRSHIPQTYAICHFV